MLDREETTRELDTILQRFLPELDGATWIAKRVEVLPGVVDSEIVYVTQQMDRLYGYTWPDTLVGQRISAIHTRTDAQITRQYSFFRHQGLEAPQHYVMHGTHPNGRVFPVIKHVQQHTIGPCTLWITRHEPWHRSAPYPFLKPLQSRSFSQADMRPFLGYASVAEAQQWLHSIPEPPAMSVLVPPVSAYDARDVRPMPDAQPPLRAAHILQPTFGHRLRQARQRYGLSLRALAQHCTPLLGRPVTRQHLSSLEWGRRRPSLPLFQALVTVLDLDPVALLAAVSDPGCHLDAHTEGRPHRLPTNMLVQVQHAAEQVAQAQQAYRETLSAAQQAGHSLRQLAAAAGQSPSRIRQLLGIIPRASAP